MANNEPPYDNRMRNLLLRLPEHNLHYRHGNVQRLLRQPEIRENYEFDPALRNHPVVGVHYPDVPRRNDAYDVIHPITKEDVDLFIQGYIDSFNSNAKRMLLSTNYLPATNGTNILAQQYPRGAWRREIMDQKPLLFRHREIVHNSDPRAPQLVKVQNGWFLVAAHPNGAFGEDALIFDRGNRNTDEISQFAQKVHIGHDVRIVRSRNLLGNELVSENGIPMSLIEQAMHTINHGKRIAQAPIYVGAPGGFPHLIAEHHIPIMKEVQHINRDRRRPQTVPYFQNLERTGRIGRGLERIAYHDTETINHLHNHPPDYWKPLGPHGPYWPPGHGPHGPNTPFPLNQYVQEEPRPMTEEEEEELAENGPPQTQDQWETEFQNNLERHNNGINYNASPTHYGSYDDDDMDFDD